MEEKLNRREFLKKTSLITVAGGTGLLTGCSLGQPEAASAPAVPTAEDTGQAATQAEPPEAAVKAVYINKNQTIEWKIVTSWPSTLPILGEGPQVMADQIETMSQGRLKIQVFASGELVPPLETFDAVDAGTAEMGHSVAYYWPDKVPAAQFFAAVPFGMDAQQMYGWILAGDGLALWEEVYQDFNIIPMPVGTTGIQMGGWFNKEINSLDDFKGMKMRIPGLGGQTIAKVGGLPELLPASEIYTNLESGAIDATEWVGPLHDLVMGFHQVAKFYYYPGWHEPGTVLELQVNRQAFEALSPDLQMIVRTAAYAQNSWMLAQFDSRNLAALQQLINEEGVVLKLFPFEVMAGLRDAAEEVIQEVADSSPIARKVFESFRKFQDEMALWGNVSERAYYNLIQKSL